MNEHSQKQGNKNKIYRFIHEHRETFRQQIADELHHQPESFRTGTGRTD